MKENIRRSVLILTNTVTVFLLTLSPILAETVDTEVIVGNIAPEFSSAPYEDPVSTHNSPTTQGTDVTFKTIGTDVNTDQYYFLVCATAGVTANSLAAPSCTEIQYCVSTATASGDEASCSYATGSEVNQINAWVSYVCDYSSSSSCSEADSGTGNSGTPFEVNHAPTFAIAPIKPSTNPGGTVTFTVLSTNWSDSDSSSGADQGKLIMCDSAGLTAGSCSGTQLCASSLTSTGSNLSCIYDDSANPVKPSDDYDAFAYVVDTHNMPAVSGAQETNVKYAINNVGPIVSNVTINGGSAITLTPNSTTNINVTAQVDDSNGCADLAVNPVSAKLYRSAIGAAGCTSDNSSCYVITNTNCVVDDGGTPNLCTGGTDISVRYKCTAALAYYTDPTTDNTPYSAEDWKSTVTAVDSSSNSDSDENLTGVELNTLNAIQLTASIDYGAVGPNQYSGGGVINIATTMTNVGNAGLDAETASSGPGLCTDYPTCEGTADVDYIPASRQRWEIANDTTAYSAGTHNLSQDLTSVPLDISKPTTASHPTSKSINWGLFVAATQVYGSYGGATTINSVVSAPGNW